MPRRAAALQAGAYCALLLVRWAGSQPAPFVVRAGAGEPRARAPPAAAPATCAGGQLPAAPPRDAAAWRASGWCSRDEPCPDEAVRAFARTNALERRLAAQPAAAAALGERRFLVCKPMGGIGNWVAGLLSCAAVAMATNRSLLLARPPPTSADKTTSYDLPVETLFDFPIDMSLSVLGHDVADVPFLVDGSGRARNEGHFHMIDLRAHDLLCHNLSLTVAAPVAVMPAHLWLAVVTRNAHHAPYFRRHFGADTYGAPLFTQFVGPWLLRPRARIMDLVHQLERAVTGGSRITGPMVGLQVGVNCEARGWHPRIEFAGEAGYGNRPDAMCRRDTRTHSMYIREHILFIAIEAGHGVRPDAMCSRATRAHSMYIREHIVYITGEAGHGNRPIGICRSTARGVRGGVCALRLFLCACLAPRQVSFAIYVGLFCHIHRSLLPYTCV
jgi:hypothetical protein